jgi:hypothetical protein
MYKEAKKKKINGYYFLFNEHGQMLYEWINGTKLSASNAQLDGIATPSSATIGQMLWYKENGNDADEGSRYTGWMQIDGAEDVGTDTDTDWYYFKKGEAKHADASDYNGLKDDGDPVYVMREKIDGKYFAFNEKGQMQTGLQFIENNTYYFDDNGYQQTGKISNVEEDDDDTYYYYFQTKNNGNGKGYNGVKDNILYFMGKRCEAEDDYRIFQIGSKYYVVNSKGRVQKTDKKYDIETLGGGVVEDVQLAPNKKTGVLTASDLEGKGLSAEEIEVPHIELCDNWIVPDENGAATIVDAGTDYKTGTLTSAD